LKRLMSFHPANPVSVTAFVVVVAAVLMAVVCGVWFAARRVGETPGRRAGWVALGLAVWVSVTSAVVASGVLRLAPMPGIPLFFFSMIGVAVWFGLSSTGKLLATGVPLPALVAFHGFRLPLELVLHSWAGHGTIPSTMTWTGQNLDIISGVVALVTAPLCVRWKAAAWVANVVGVVLLVNVGRVAMMSSPLPFAWEVQPPLQLILYLPYAWIGSVCVAGAVAGHVVLTRALLCKG